MLCEGGTTWVIPTCQTPYKYKLAARQPGNTQNASGLELGRSEAAWSEEGLKQSDVDVRSR